MTCIVGVVEKDRIYIGADSAGVSGLNVTIRKDPKVFKLGGDMLVGFTGSFRAGQLVMHGFKVPDRSKGRDAYEWMVTTFVDALRRRLKSGGYAKREYEVEEGGDFMVAVAGRLFVIESDYQVGEREDPFDAIGCGEEYALGSLFASEKVKSAEARIMTALGAAAKFSGGVAPPFRMLDLAGGIE